MKAKTWVLIAAGGLAACAAGWRLSQPSIEEKGTTPGAPAGPVTALPQGTAEAKAEEVEPPDDEPAPADDPRVVKWVFSAAAGVEMARNEVTVDAYLRCYHADACSNEGVDSVQGRGGPAQFLLACHWNDFRDQPMADAMRPMNCVSASDAEAFCKWAGGRLPTYSEWLAEATNKGQRAYPWGNERPSCERAVILEELNEDGCGRGEWRVCSKRVGDSISGLCDMIGNVSEYVRHDGGYLEVGGSSWSAFDELDAENLQRGRPRGREVRTDSIGFRCARDATR